MSNIKDKFIKTREERYNGNISNLTFAKYIGDSNSTKLSNLNGLIYIINETVYFEDFKPNAPLFSIGTPDTEYEKTEFNIPLSQIVRIDNIDEKDAIRSIKNGISYKKIPPVKGWLKKIFTSSVSMLEFENNAKFFSITNLEDFSKTVVDFFI